MNKRLALVIGLLLVVPMLLAACGSMESSEAEEGFQAVFRGDYDAAEEYFCDDELDDIRDDADWQQITAMVNENEMDVQVDCEKDGGDMVCNVMGQEFKMNINWEGKLCGLAD
jgi:hypothetical protein